MAAVQTVRIEANVGWNVFQSPTSKRWLAVCDDLNICLEGDSETELRSLIPEALHLLMSDLLGDTELDAFLREKGWYAHNLPVSPVGEIKFDVPWHVVAEGARRDPERRSH
jgi:hypothetical protein